MASDPYVRVRQRFDEIVAEAKKSVAEQNGGNAQKSRQGQLSPEEKYTDCYKKKQEIKKSIAGFEKKEYYRLAQYECLTGGLYFSRMACLGRDDERDVLQGIVFYLNEKLIDKKLSETKKELKAVSFEDFLNSNGDEFFYKMDERSPIISEKEDERICAWQTKKKISCIKLEFGKLRENFKNAIKGEILTMDIVRHEIKSLENIFGNAAYWKASKLIEEIRKLKALAGILMPEDLQEFHRLFVLFFNGHNLDYQLSPSFFEKAQNDIELSRCSELPVFCFSLSMYCRWLHHIATFKIDVFDKEESSFDNLYTKTHEEGIKGKYSWINRFEEINIKNSMSAGHYESLLTEAMEKQRRILNNLEFPCYFNLMEDKEKLKNCFINDCLRSFNLELPKEELRKAIMLNENIVWLNEKLCQLKHNPILPPGKLIKDNAYLLEILCLIAPDSKTINGFLDCIKVIKEQISNDRISMYVINENANCLFEKVLEEAKGNFKKSVERMDIDKRGYFIANLLRELNYLETKYHTKCKGKIFFFKEIKQMVKNELNSAEIMHNFNPTESMDTSKEKKRTKNKILSFGYKPGPRPYIPIVKAMCLKMNLVTGDNAVDDFMEVVTAPDLSKVTKKIQLATKLTVFSKFILKSKPWFEHFTPARIEQSGIFISWKEGPVTAKVIYNSKEILKEEDDLVEEIFKAKYNTGKEAENK